MILLSLLLSLLLLLSIFYKSNIDEEEIEREKYEKLTRKIYGY